MFAVNRFKAAAAVVAVAALLAGCASADKTTSTAASASATSSGNSGSMPGMNMGNSGTASSGGTVDGIKPVPTQTLASATWQGMKITARAMTAVPFVIYNGTSEQMVMPGPHASFHLMVLLNRGSGAGRIGVRGAARGADSGRAHHLHVRHVEALDAADVDDHHDNLVAGRAASDGARCLRVHAEFGDQRGALAV
jgi:hypothetical protein